MQVLMRQFPILFALAMLSACASTSLVNSWKDPQYNSGPIRKVLVVGVASQADVRRVFEDTFVQALTTQGVRAVPGYKLVATDGEISEDALTKAVEQAGADGILITRMVRRETEIAIAPSSSLPAPAIGMRPYYRGYYAGAWTGYYDPPTVLQYDYVVAETTLFKTDAPEPVWSGTTRTSEPQDVRKATEGFAKVVIKALKKEGLI